MKNALTWGLVIGVLSGLWLFIMHWMGYDIKDDKASPYEYFSVLIPVVVLLLGIKSYRDTVLGGNMSFLEGLIESFKILLVGGVLAAFAGIVYINYVTEGNNYSAFSGRLFGALLVGLLSALGVSLVLATKSNKLD
ncbi:DUF4199 domain-containing protein [Mucilaginibacter auburnensis]|uniref:Uncharacterized protein DUF4199 n=1 Tax=Mucilaginibacter auburnensis TaxID=1457233 RepID=A0A2H9VR23_9SPHI|nr:DUF4199 domain-containing protein [Mucilaginibacter auburnensis]PJJ83282.1 uncharacterized protein DUF4199 [Mucilaginibacter auburnensis]